MPEAYSKGFRLDVLRDCDAGLGTQAVALKHNVSESWVRRCKQQRRETGQVEVKKTRECKAGWHDWADWLNATVAAQPDLYLREIQVKLKAERNVEVSEEWIGKVCHMLDVTQKKTLIAAEQDREDVAVKRRQWAENIRRFDPHALVFLDETWACSSSPHDDHDADLRKSDDRRARDRERTVRTLENNDVSGSDSQYRIHRPVVSRRCHQRGGLPGLG